MPATSAKAEYQTENVDPALENGPLAKRQCRDVLCCLLFIIFLAGMLGIGIWGYSQGNPRLIGRGYDKDGKMCGVDDGYEDYPYLYFPLPFSGYLTNTVCLSACPSTDPLPSSLNSVCKTTSYHSSCNANPTSTGFSNMMADYNANTGHVDNKFYIYETTGYVSRFCVPQKVGETLAASNAVLNSDLLEKWISDIRETWPVIAISVAVAFIIGFVYMVLLRYCSGVLTWLAIFAFIVGTAILGWRFYDSAKKLEEETASTGSEENTESSSYKTVTAQKVIAYICWGVAGFTFLAVLCLFSRIRLAIAILKAAADYVKDTPSVFLVPPVIVVLLLVFYAFWASSAIFLISSGDTQQISGTPFGTFTFDKRLQRLLIYHLFGLLWVNAFVLASTQFILASSTALWYFSQGTGQSAPKTIRTSISRLFKYHFGSIAFGSLILAIVQMIRLILAYMEAQANKMQGKENKLIKWTLRCLQCYVACFERFIKFLNKNAYIQIALTGKGFCGAAKDAFMLIAKNPLRLGVVSSIGGVFVLFGKVFVASITSLIAFLVLTNWDNYSTKIYSPFIPTLIVFIFSYVVGAIFMTVYGLAADTILACFIVDEQLSGNAPARHCPASLREFLNKHDKRKN